MVSRSNYAETRKEKTMFTTMTFRPKGHTGRDPLAQQRHEASLRAETSRRHAPVIQKLNQPTAPAPETTEAKQWRLYRERLAAWKSHQPVPVPPDKQPRPIEIRNN
jgi:hypothetical protein